MGERIEFRPDGPHSSTYTTDLAWAFAEAVRVLNHATGPHAARGLRYPSTVYDVAGALATGAAGLGQLMTQIGAFLNREAAAGHLADTSGTDPRATVRNAALAVRDAECAAAALADAFRGLQSAVSGLYVPDAGDAEGCGAEFIDGSWTYCGCAECDEREADEQDRDIEYGADDLSPCGMPTESEPCPQHRPDIGKAVR